MREMLADGLAKVHPVFGERSLFERIAGTPLRGRLFAAYLGAGSTET